MKYLPRIVDSEIKELMKIMGAVLIEGCKWCGKSTTGLYHAKSVIEFQNPDKKQVYDEIKNTKPSLFLNGDKPRMFDEWQMYPAPNFISIAPHVPLLVLKIASTSKFFSSR